jgi:hypothetical protein
MTGVGSGASNWCRLQHFRFTPTSRRRSGQAQHSALLELAPKSDRIGLRWGGTSLSGIGDVLNPEFSDAITP